MLFITAFYGKNIPENRKNKENPLQSHFCGGFFASFEGNPFLPVFRPDFFAKTTINAEKNQKEILKKSCKSTEKLLHFCISTGIIYFKG